MRWHCWTELGACRPCNIPQVRHCHADEGDKQSAEKPNVAAAAAQVGEIDIDSELVASSQRLDGKEEARIMMLNNGCLCCTVRDDLVDMLTELVSLWLTHRLHAASGCLPQVC